MLSITYRILDTVGESVVLPIGGKINVAIKVTGTLTGTLEFEYSRDQYSYEAATVYEWHTAIPITAATAAGNWYWRNADYNFFRVRRTDFRMGSGEPYVTLGASEDGSFADVFLEPYQRFRVSDGTANTTNTMAIDKSEDKAHRLTRLVVSYSGGVPSVAETVINDGETRLWNVWLRPRAGVHEVPLPSEGILGSPFRDLNIVVPAAGEGIVSRICAEVRSA